MPVSIILGILCIGLAVWFELCAAFGMSVRRLALRLRSLDTCHMISLV